MKKIIKNFIEKYFIQLVSISVGLIFVSAGMYAYKKDTQYKIYLHFKNKPSIKRMNKYMQECFNKEGKRFIFEKKDGVKLVLRGWYIKCK